MEQLWQVMGELQLADVGLQLAMYNAIDSENYTIFKPTKKHKKMQNIMLDKFIAWGTVLKTLCKESLP